MPILSDRTRLGPGGRPTGVDGDEQMMLRMYKVMNVEESPARTTRIAVGERDSLSFLAALRLTLNRLDIIQTNP